MLKDWLDKIKLDLYLLSPIWLA